MAGFAMGVGTGFFSKMSQVQDENRKQEQEMLMEDYREFNKSLTVYRTAKAEQQKQDNIVRGFAMQISGDPRDQKAIDIARSFVSGGHDIKDATTLAKAQSQYKNSILGAAKTNIENSPQAQAQGAAPADPSQAAPGLGGAPAPAPTDTPQGQMQAPSIMGANKDTAKNVFLNKSTPDQLGAKSVKNIAGRTGMTPEQVTAIKTGADTGQTPFNPETKIAPGNPGEGLLIQAAMKMAAEGKIKDAPGFFGAINKGDWEGAGKFLPTLAEQNAWHAEVAKIEADYRERAAAGNNAATIQSANIQAQATKDAAKLRQEGSPHERYGQAAAALEAAKGQVKEDPALISKYKSKFPSFDPTNDRDVEWAALQELDTESRARVLAGPNNKPDNSITGSAMDYRRQPHPPSHKPAKPGDKPASVTEPPAPTSSTISPQVEAKKVADMIKLIKDPAKLEDAKKRYLQDYPKYYTENFLPEEQKKKNDKKKTSDKEEENNKAMKSLKNTNVKDFTE